MKKSHLITVLSMVVIFGVIVAFNTKHAAPLVSATSVSLFRDQVPYNWNGVKYSESGIYRDTLSAINGEDSIATLSLIVSKEEYNSIPVFYNKVGQMQYTQVKIWADTVTPTSNQYTIDISSAGFTQIISATVSAQNNTSTVGSMPEVDIKSVSTTQVVVNIMTSNTSLVSVLGFSVLSGSGLIAAPSVSGFILNVKVFGI